MRILLIVLITGFCNLLLSQTDPDYIFRERYTEKKSQNIYKITEIYNNDLIAVGYTTHGSIGRKDIYYAKIGKDGQKLNAASIGGSYDDVANSVIFTPSGRILLCGYTESKGGIRQGIILEIRKDMSTDLFYLDEKETHSEYSDLLYDRDENIYVCGTRSDTMFVSKFDREGNLVRTYRLGERSSGRAMCLTRDGKIAVTGSVKKRKGWALIIVKLDPLSDETMERHYSQDDCFIGNDIVEMPNGNLAIAATGIRSRFKAPALVFFSGTGLQVGGKPFETEIDGAGTGIALTPCGDLVLTGIGSDLRNAKRTSSFAVRVNPNNLGNPLTKEPYFFRNDHEDQCNTAYCTSEGNMILAGMFSNIYSTTDYYLYALRPTVRDMQAMDILKHIKMLQPARQDVYRNDEEKFEISLTNESNQVITNFKIRIETENSGTGDIRIPEYILVDKIYGGETKKITFPVSISEAFGSDVFSLKYTLLNTNNISYATARANARIIGSRSALYKTGNEEQYVDLHNRNHVVIPVKLTNIGTSRSIIKNMSFRFNENIFLSEDSETITDVTVQAGETYAFDLVCYADSLFRDDHISVHISLDELSGLRIADEEIRRQDLRRAYPVVNNRLADDDVRAVFLEDDQAIRFPNISPELRLKDRKTYRMDIRYQGGLEDLTSKLSFFINNRKVPADSVTTDPEKAGSYTVNLPLGYGVNDVTCQRYPSLEVVNLSRIEVEKSDASYYVYVIGTDIKNEDDIPLVRYSIKDVNDFSNRMKEYERNHGDNIYVTVYNTYSTSTNAFINGIFKDIYKRKNKFKANDVILIYWVAQAFATADGNIRVMGSDLFSDKKKKFTPEFYSSPLTKYIIPFYLDALPCRKILMLDLFYKEDLSEKKDKEDKDIEDYDLVDKTIKAIHSFNNFDYILSGNSGQKSYALENLNNGAFTYAVLQALNNKETDLNNDQAIGLSEFFANISKTIPDIVSRNRREKYWKQEPCHIKSIPEEDIVIMYR